MKVMRDVDARVLEFVDAARGQDLDRLLREGGHDVSGSAPISR